MKVFLTTVLFFLALACTENRWNSAEIISVDTLVVHDSVDYGRIGNWPTGFELTHFADIDSVWEKPVRFYIDNRACDPIAIDFYFGTYTPSDNRPTEHLLNFAYTDNESLGPFYRWILHRTIISQDVKLAEQTGRPARLYVQKFPKEFFA
jgi:hypothetical protein